MVLADEDDVDDDTEESRRSRQYVEEERPRKHDPHRHQRLQLQGLGGAVLPQGLPARDRLTYYARAFDTVEWIRPTTIPKAKSFSAMAARRPGFLFA